MNPDEYCRDKAAPAGSSAHYSLLFLDEDRRRAVTALWAFAREVREVTAECRDAGVARVKLQWWREEVQRLFEGRPRHPVGHALAPVVAAHALPADHFLEILHGVETDVGRFSYPTFQDLTLYCHRVASMACLMTARVLGVSDDGTLGYAHHLGTALQLTRIVRDVRRDGAAGRVYIPLDELARYKVPPEDLMAGRGADGAGRLIRFQVERARDYYRTALERLPEADRYGQRSGIVLAQIRLATLQEIEADDYHVWDRRIRLTPLRKLWIAWRSERSERRRMKRRRAAARA